jgi:hypothetical protein
MDVNTNSDPNPKERKGEDPAERPDQEEVVTERDPKPAPDPMKPVPATPDANPIDPRVGQPW